MPQVITSSLRAFTVADLNEATCGTATYKGHSFGHTIKVVDLIYVGRNDCKGRIYEFKAHSCCPALHGYTGRVAITDRGTLTIMD